MPDTRAQFIARIKMEAAKNIREDPPGSNICEITHRFEKRFGWGDREPWCAETVSVVGLDGGVLPPECASAGAKDLMDRMHKQGLGRTFQNIHFPCVIAYNYGHGHTGFLLGYNPVTQMGLAWEGNTGNGDPREGDGCYYRNRDLSGNTVYGLGDLVFAPDKHGVTTGKPADRFLYLKTPPFTGLDVAGVQHALVVAGNRDLKVTGIFDQHTADLVNLLNVNHHVIDPKTQKPARGVVAGTWVVLRQFVHH